MARPALTSVGGRSDAYIGQRAASIIAARCAPAECPAMRCARIEAQAVTVAVQPRQRGELFVRPCLRSALPAQAVVRQCQCNAVLPEARRQPREIGLVERAPIAPMDEHQQRRGLALRREIVEPFGRRLAIGQVAEAGSQPARLRSALGPAREDLRMLGQQSPYVVFAVEICCVVLHPCSVGGASVATVDRAAMGLNALSGRSIIRPLPRRLPAGNRGSSSAGRALRSQCRGRSSILLFSTRFFAVL